VFSSKPIPEFLSTHLHVSSAIFPARYVLARFLELPYPRQSFSFLKRTLSWLTISKRPRYPDLPLTVRILPWQSNCSAFPFPLWVFTSNVSRPSRYMQPPQGAIPFPTKGFIVPSPLAPATFDSLCLSLLIEDCLRFFCPSNLTCGLACSPFPFVIFLFQGRLSLFPQDP